MHHRTRLSGRPPMARPPVARTAAAIIATVGLALLTPACSSPSSTGPGGSTDAGLAASPVAVGYSHCMRSHGVPDFPDPTRSGGVPKVGPQQVGVSSSLYQAALAACAQLLQPTQAELPQIMTGMLHFARCMRSHGVPNWPDPTTGRDGQPEFRIPGIDPDSSQISDTADRCTDLLVQSSTGPTTIELCDGVGEGAGCHGYGRPPGS